MSTCSNCGALFPPDDTRCPECGIETDLSSPRKRDESLTIDSEVDDEIANSDNGFAADRERIDDEGLSGRDETAVYASETERDEKLEKTTKTQTTEADVSVTTNKDLTLDVDDEPEGAQKPAYRDPNQPESAESQLAPDRDTEGSAANSQNNSATQAEMLPPAYGSVALAVAEEMERATSEDQSQDAVDESEPPASLSESEAQQDDESAAAQSAEEHQEEKPGAASENDSIPHAKDETAEELPFPARPPVLASEALREQLAPTEPGRDTIRILSVVVGAFGTVTMLLLFGTSGMGFPLAGAFLALTAFALPSIPYAPRAAAVFTISASTLGVVTWMYVGFIGTPAEVVETVAVVTLATALQYRAWHRASLAARFLVATGILVSVGWLGMSGWLKDFTTLDPAWQSWLPTIIRAPFALLLMLSLLAFMDARTTGGCGIWATAVMFWHALHMTVQLMILVWPKESHAPNWQILSGELSTITAASIAGPLLTVLVVFGVAQLLAVAFTVEAGAREKPFI